MNKITTLKRQIIALESMGQFELEAKFHDLFGFDAPKSNAKNIRTRLACKIQEELLGGISEEDLQKLKDIADADPLANLSQKGSRKQTILKGTRYKKTWNGKNYFVTVMENGKFEFEEEVYRSLSAIADKITGTHWNGKKFFGVK